MVIEYRASLHENTIARGVVGFGRELAFERGKLVSPQTYQWS